MIIFRTRAISLSIPPPGHIVAIDPEIATPEFFACELAGYRISTSKENSVRKIPPAGKFRRPGESLDVP